MKLRETLVRGLKLLTRPVVVRSFLLLGAVAVALLIAEAGLRVTGFSHFNPYIADREVGFSLRPNAEGWWRKEGLTGKCDLRSTMPVPDSETHFAMMLGRYSSCVNVI